MSLDDTIAYPVVAHVDGARALATNSVVHDSVGGGIVLMRVEGTGENRLACRNVMRSLVVLDAMAALAWSGADGVGSMRQRPLGRKCGRSAVTALAWRGAGEVGALAGRCMRQRPLASRGPEKSCCG